MAEKARSVAFLPAALRTRSDEYGGAPLRGSVARWFF
jgi:hypothetical protein